MSGWGPDQRGVTEPLREDVQQRYDDGPRVVGYFGASTSLPEAAADLARSDVANPRREDKRRGRAYSADADDDL